MLMQSLLQGVLHSAQVKHFLHRRLPIALIVLRSGEDRRTVIGEEDCVSDPIGSSPTANGVLRMVVFSQNAVTSSHLRTYLLCFSLMSETPFLSHLAT